VSIQLTVPPTIRPFRGWADPALPDGFWVVHASVLGDASGGLQSINIRFSSAGQPNVSNLWNIEQMILGMSTPSAQRVRMDFGNMDIQPVGISTGALTKLVSLLLEDLGAAPASGALAKLKDDMPIFLGSAGKEVNGDVAWDVTNILNVSFNVFVQGYFWGPGAINAEGGPQRPATGLFGQ